MVDPFESSDSVRSGAPLQHVQTAVFPEPLRLRHGGTLPGVEVAYETYGTLNEDGSNAVLICHAITGDSHVARHDPGDDPGWWEGLIGPGKAVDTDRVFTFAPGAPAEPATTWTLHARLHLPIDREEASLPIVIYGHGLGGDRGESDGRARDLAGLGMAVVALDAPAHGDHPTATSSEDFFWIFHFFGIDPATQAFDVFQLRNNWRIAAHDKLQLVAALRRGIDLDGDGDSDVEADPIV